jgi:hypothetical protein
MRTKEQVYDEDIAPLMGRILEICKENKIALVASFHCPNDANDGLFCSSVLLGGRYGKPLELVELAMVLNRYLPSATAADIITTQKEM